MERNYLILPVDKVQTEQTCLELLDDFAMLNLDGMNAYAEKMLEAFVNELNLY